MFDAPRLGRYYPDAVFEPERLALFQWLVVEERVRIDHRPDARAMPFLYEGFDRDTGAFDPHRGAYPEAVEAALFFLLQAPWEDWSTYPQVDWRGFRIPWVHAVDEDLFVRPSAPPNADSLTLEPWITYDHHGEEEELETTTALPLDDAAATLAGLDGGEMEGAREGLSRRSAADPGRPLSRAWFRRGRHGRGDGPYDLYRGGSRNRGGSLQTAAAQDRACALFSDRPGGREDHRPAGRRRGRLGLQGVVRPPQHLRSRSRRSGRRVHGPARSRPADWPDASPPP